MKTTEQKSSPSLADKVLPAFCVLCAAGAGITGTMLLMENRAQTSASPAAQKGSSGTALQSTNGAAPFADALPKAAPDASAMSSTAPGANAPNVGAVLDPNAPDTHQHGPPPSTAGMQPTQAALTMANWHYDVAHWNEAITKYQETISLGLDNPNVRTDLGNCFRFSAQPQKALEQYEIAQKQNPKHEESLFNQAGLFAAELKQPQRGVQIWNEYLKRFPKGKSVAAAKKLIARYEK